MIINFITLLRLYGGKIIDFAFMSLDIDELCNDTRWLEININL